MTRTVICVLDHVLHGYQSYGIAQQQWSTYPAFENELLPRCKPITDMRNVWFTFFLEQKRVDWQLHMFSHFLSHPVVITSSWTHSSPWKLISSDKLLRLQLDIRLGWNLMNILWSCQNIHVAGTQAIRHRPKTGGTYFTSNSKIAILPKCFTSCDTPKLLRNFSHAFTRMLRITVLLWYWFRKVDVITSRRNLLWDN